MNKITAEITYDSAIVTVHFNGEVYGSKTTFDENGEIKTERFGGSVKKLIEENPEGTAEYRFFEGVEASLVGIESMWMALRKLERK